MDVLTCVVCGKPATQKYLTIRSDVDPIYADVCDECAVKHTWQCIDLHLQIADYERDWPNYCRKCGGWGGVSVPQTYWEPGDFDVCECICSGKCPRCGHQHDEDWEGEDCEECCWHYDQDGILEAECHCDEPEDERTMRHFTQDNPVIEFELGSKTVVSDPCYPSVGDGCSLVLDTKPGKWLATVDVVDEYFWVNRVAALRAWTLGVVTDTYEPHDVCVDSGQMSIVDYDYYEGDNEGFGDEDTFYGDACALTLAEGAFGGLLKSGRGVVSTTGYGDGGYRVVLKYDSDQQVIGIMVVFIEDEDDYNEDEDDWDEEW